MSQTTPKTPRRLTSAPSTASATDAGDTSDNQFTTPKAKGSLKRNHDTVEASDTIYSIDKRFVVSRQHGYPPSQIHGWGALLCDGPPSDDYYVPEPLPPKKRRRTEPRPVVSKPAPTLNGDSSWSDFDFSSDGFGDWRSSDDRIDEEEEEEEEKEEEEVDEKDLPWYKRERLERVDAMIKKSDEYAEQEDAEEELERAANRGKADPIDAVDNATEEAEVVEDGALTDAGNGGIVLAEPEATDNEDDDAPEEA
ncbi:hypothetical protein CC1G_08682 [Coprinopsis cinerea okayama7|uniref:Uncharacterized protein n=1 Tax=Coprinopsis cinerea (strain Okayama-7 / 130 / ATCC MYA-4618 / FGSC 9003) TaxID=240176 RepID=A8NZF8_COPC7|nr:hypothetical protein CC1G_08682 [Coprinopsis cinerea okayama7\|eukprot:XP_001837669.1 hypothetical protein CC1G_08682 [Coprinopsis cinerea okayama7\